MQLSKKKIVFLEEITIKHSPFLDKIKAQLNPMKKLSCLAALIFTLSGYCQKSDRQILMTTIDELNKIETVRY